MILFFQESLLQLVLRNKFGNPFIVTQEVFFFVKFVYSAINSSILKISSFAGSIIVAISSSDIE